MNNRLINARGVAGVNSNILPTPGRSATAPGLAPGSGVLHQLPLFNRQAQPDAPLRVEAYHLTPGRWYSCIDTSTGRSFGGRYSAREVDYIAAEFRDWPPKPITPVEFGVVAEAAIRQSQGFCHIPTDKSDRWVGGAA